jgi:hypothetical protein
MMTRPDIAHSVAYLARFNSNPGPEHWKALKHLFRYVKGTFNHNLTYQGDLANTEPFITYSSLMPLMVIVLIPDALLLDM